MPRLIQKFPNYYNQKPAILQTIHTGMAQFLCCRRKQDGLPSEFSGRTCRFQKLPIQKNTHKSFGNGSQYTCKAMRRRKFAFKTDRFGRAFRVFARGLADQFPSMTDSRQGIIPCHSPDTIELQLMNLTFIYRRFSKGRKIRIRNLQIGLLQSQKGDFYETISGKRYKGKM